MALKRADIRKILENTETSNEDKAKALLDAFHEENDALRDQLDTAKNDLAKAEKERDAANSGKEAAEKSLTDYKTQQSAKDTRAAKAAKCKELLKKAGVLDKYIEDIVSDSKKGEEFINALELDEKGEIRDADKQLEKAKTEFSGKIGKTTTTGAKVDTPPTSYTGTSPEEFKKMSLDERIKLKNSNPELYQQLRAK